MSNSNQILQFMQELKLLGMHQAFETLIESNQHQNLTADETLHLLVQAELEERKSKKLMSLLRSSCFRYQACLEEITFPAKRNLDKNAFLRLADCGYIARKENILITGPSGVGKSFIATALGYQACYNGYKTLYFNIQKLFNKTAVFKADGTYMKEIRKIEIKDLLIIDDFGLTPFNAERRMELLEIIEDRYGRKSTIVCSQLPVEKWYEVIGDGTIADAILDRLVNGSHRFELKGESLRKMA